MPCIMLRLRPNMVTLVPVNRLKPLRESLLRECELLSLCRLDGLSGQTAEVDCDTRADTADAACLRCCEARYTNSESETAGAGFQHKRFDHSVVGSDGLDTCMTIT